MMALAVSMDRKRIVQSELAPARQSIYTLLTFAFREPPKLGLLLGFTSDPILVESRQLFVQTVVTAFHRCIAGAGSAAEWEEEALREFMNLFKVPGLQYVMPYEAVYRDSREINGKKVTGLLAGPSTSDVQKWYRLAAAEVAGDFKDLPDHIALELNFIAHLCCKERQFAQAGDEAHLTRTWEMERDFLAGHVNRWIEALRDKIHEKTQHAYFRTVSELAVNIAQDDLIALESLVGPSKGHATPQYGGMSD